MKAYLAAGWFSPEQEQARCEVLGALKEAGWDFYSPKDHGLYVPGEIEAVEVFTENLTRIRECDVVIASTAGKDMGTLFECGYAYGHATPIVYYFRGPGKLNLMLAESGYAAFDNPHTLTAYLIMCKKDEVIYHVGIGGERE